MQREVGPRAQQLMHKKTKFLTGLTPHQVARVPNGDRIVLAELDRIVLAGFKGQRSRK